MNRTVPPGNRGDRSPDPGRASRLAGLCLALSDWSAELRLLEKVEVTDGTT
jgi:hypothetical protein